MKKLRKALFISLIVIIGLLYAFPYLFLGTLTNLAKDEINKLVKAKVEFDNTSLSIWHHFPNLTLDIDKILVTGKDAFEGDTLTFINNLSVTIDLFSVIAGETYTIKSIEVNSPLLYLKTLPDGQSNYNIVESDDASGPSDDQPEEKYELRLKRVKINDGIVNYLDEQSKIELGLSGIDFRFSGGFTQEKSDVSLRFLANSFDLNYQNIDYFSKTKIVYEADLGVNSKTETYHLNKNELSLNDVLLSLSGEAKILDEGYELDMSFKTINNDFKSLLSLVPAIYTNEFDELTADGNFSVEGVIKGLYRDESLPAFSIEVSLENGRFQYPDLPGAATGIFAKVRAENPGGSSDNTIFDINRFEMMLGENPFAMNMHVKTPVSDPLISMRVDGTIDLGTIKDFYPLGQENDFKGIFNANFNLYGKYSDIENDNYENITASGKLSADNVVYNTTLVNEPIVVEKAELDFTPRLIDLKSVNLKIGKNDLVATGKINNYLAYLGNGTLKGVLKTTSSYMNIDALTGNNDAKSEPEGENNKGGKEESSIIEIPDRLDLKLTSKFKTLVYDSLLLHNVSGTIAVNDQHLMLQNVKSDAVGGQMVVNGSYWLPEPEKPEIDLKVSLKGIDIPTSYTSFSIIRKYLPITKKTTGNLSATFNLNSRLGKDMIPAFETMNGKGNISTSSIKINGLNTLTEIARILYFDELKNPQLKPVKASFKFVNGKMITKPFDIQYKTTKATIEGWTAFDEKIGYLMSIEIPRALLGEKSTQLLDEIAREAKKLGVQYELPETLTIGVGIEGTLSKPLIKTDLKQQGNDLIEKAKKEMEKQIRKELQEQADKIIAEAEKRATSLINEAKKQAKNLKASAEKSVAKLNAETDNQVKKLIEEAKKQGPLAEFAAKEAAKQLKNESAKKVADLMKETDKQIDKIIKEARNQAGIIRKDAKLKADNLLGG